MTELNSKPISAPAATIQALQVHRLLPVAGLLAGRGLLRQDLVSLADQLTARSVDDERQRAAIEDAVLAALNAAGVDVLVLKGALLARTVYPAPAARLRTDIDLLVPEAAVDEACAALRDIGFVPSYEVHGGPPMTQAQWIRRGDKPVHAVDLHWDLFNLPLLKAKFGFAALRARAQRVPGLGDRAFGLSAPDALIHACTHYFGHHQGEFRPDQWLLDMDLLWTAMDGRARGLALELARDACVASLVAAGLKLASARFAGPIGSAEITAFEQAGRGERSARLLEVPKFRAWGMVRSALDERGLCAKVRYLYRLAFPPVAYMRAKYPDAPSWALPWLYVRRVVNGLTG